MYEYIPIIVICYNNYKYVKNTLEQIQNINTIYYKNIIIMDNCSTCIDTINFLKNIDVNIIYRKINSSPQISIEYNSDVYNTLPDKFILTDPDLEFNINLPKNFIEILSNLSDQYNSYKIGFALDISDYDKMYQGIYYNGYNIYDWEYKFWKNKIKNSKYELYKADIDTTFALINKKNIYNNIRIAGDFTAKHIPWYIDNKINNLYKNYILCLQQTKISTIKNMIIKYIDSNYTKIYKKNEMFLIKNNDLYINFWKNKYMSCWKNIYIPWKNKSFDIIDKYIDKNKIFIDIGSSIGEFSLYASRKFKHVYCIETDKKLFNNLSTNMKNNCNNNFTLINKDIINDIDKIFTDYNINKNEIVLININIKGIEEDLLFDLYNIHNKYNIPLHIYFYYDKWKNKNLDRFYFLDDIKKKNIKTNSQEFILFSNHNIKSIEKNKNYLNFYFFIFILLCIIFIIYIYYNEN